MISERVSHPFIGRFHSPAGCISYPVSPSSITVHIRTHLGAQVIVFLWQGDLHNQVLGCLAWRHMVLEIVSPLMVQEKSDHRDPGTLAADPDFGNDLQEEGSAAWHMHLHLHGSQATLVDRTGLRQEPGNRSNPLRLDHRDIA